jgi:hypothetical protein
MLPAPRANRSSHEVPLDLLQGPALSLLPRRGSSRRLPYRIWGYRGRAAADILPTAAVAASAPVASVTITWADGTVTTVCPPETPARPVNATPANWPRGLPGSDEPGGLPPLRPGGRRGCQGPPSRVTYPGKTRVALHAVGPLFCLLGPVRPNRQVRPVGVPGLEPGTSSLSGKRSNRLSYTPVGVSRKEDLVTLSHPGDCFSLSRGE